MKDLYRYALIAALVCIAAVIVILVFTQSMAPSETDGKNGPRNDDFSSKRFPPEITLEVNGETVPGVEGSYCWYGEEHVCVDKIGPRSLLDGVEAVAVPADAAYRLTAPRYVRPDEFRYTVYWPNNTLRESGNASRSFTPDVSPGTYFVGGHAWWDDTGDVGYFFKVTVQ